MLSRAATTILTLALTAILFAACGEGETPPAGGGQGGNQAGGELRVDYPLADSVFPPDFAPPTFLWHDEDSRTNAWWITVVFSDEGERLTAESDGPPPPQGEIDETVIGPTNELYEGTPYQQSAHSWTPAPPFWAEIQRRSSEAPVTVAIEGFVRGEPTKMLSRGEVTFTTSKDPVGATIFYRDVPLMPAEGADGKIAPLDRNAYGLIGWRLRDVSHPESKLILTGMPSCANCHSFSSDGNTLGMDVDGPEGDKGTYAIAPLAKTTVIGDEQIITWNSFPDKPEGHRTIGFLSRISPDGSHVLSTVNEALYVNNFTNYKFLQVFYPTRGILAWYSKETGEMKALPGADDPEYVHCSPVWFPDGSEIVFARAKARDPYPDDQPRPTHAGDPNELQIQYDLYRMPFNGGAGGTPVPIEGASGNGMSNTFPKISPDGKWLVYTKCKNGLLMRPDGRLWIVPSAGGEAREMNCNTKLMNSWHSFSPNGRWMVFSSKSNTPYTQMFLTHLDEDGNDTPPILIENSTAANRAVNIPEFVNRDFDAFDVIDVPAVKHHRLYQEGMDFATAGDYEQAIPLFERSVERDPEFSRALVALGNALMETGRIDEARKRLEKAIEVEPRSAPAYMNLGLTWLREDQPDRAIELFDRAIELAPGFHLAHHNRGIVLAMQGKHGAALESLALAVRLKPREARMRRDLGHLLQVMGRWDDAIAVYRHGLELDPENPLAMETLAFALLETGQKEESLLYVRRAAKLAAGNVELRRSLGQTLLRMGRPVEALVQLDQVLELSPEDVETAMTVAWLLSTLPQDKVRDGKRAVRLAERCRKDIGERADVLDVLAAAYAEAGRFPEAVKTAERALTLEKAGTGTAAPGLTERIKEYQAGRPHR